MAYSVMLLLKYKKITRNCGDNTNKSKTNRVSATRNVVPRWVHDIMEGNDVMKICVCVCVRARAQILRHTSYMTQEYLEGIPLSILSDLMNGWAKKGGRKHHAHTASLARTRYG